VVRRETTKEMKRKSERKGFKRERDIKKETESGRTGTKKKMKRKRERKKSKGRERGLKKETESGRTGSKFMRR
jgi:hypothetical protein